jgi:hypothetical protein
MTPCRAEPTQQSSFSVPALLHPAVQSNQVHVDVPRVKLHMWNGIAPGINDLLDSYIQTRLGILCDCEAEAQIRFRHLGQFFMEPSDYCDAPIDKVLHFIQDVGLIKG